MDIDERVLRLLSTACPRPIELARLTPELMLRQDLGIDSIALVTVIFQFEQEFNINLLELEADFSGIETVGDVLAKAREIVKAGAEARPA
ncbi:phosphopantetheine-binding protein [Sorangium sp. So ce1151]|uniref:phosphopantetheine-binding protein n=1 Tax=Sorangium sp. So ce1151 TaxID=3133332 RepID=UPI003F62AC83